ncbi:MAG: citramalate synthase [Candidatus Omnitrophica bacterium]|nr:citramalate synthase [Candidatus Omnitrophota bacterium]MBU1523901.1 citramalate synthase [Candidatus Omnitrophota bacterium]MBU2437448.1 citramalate synthase [Candidatus Omnitrophota bacterium]
MRRIFIYDTTLRDGAQTEGISYSLQDKINIAKRLDDFGIDFIEPGWPYSNSKDKQVFDYFKKHHLKKSKLVPFGSTAHPSGPAYKDKNLISLIKSDTEYVTIFGKTWNLHVKEVLKISLEDNLKIIFESIKFLKKKGKKVFYDAEHFFDGYKANPAYALKTLKAAQEAGGELIIFCDTNGGTLPQEVKRITSEVKGKLSLDNFGIHCHNDLGLAIANSLILLEDGCIQVQGTVNGYGERCGNVDLISIIAILQSKMGYNIVSSQKIEELTHLSHFVSEISNMAHRDNSPFVGRSAFAHKGGVHIDAVIKNPLAYEHVFPSLVGNKRRFVVSELAGKSTLVAKAKELKFDLDKRSSQAKKLYNLLQKLEKDGYQFEAAEGSFKLLLEKEFKRYKKFFDLLGFRVIIEKREDNKLISEATIRLKINNKLEHTASQGDGPVNALDNALRKALRNFYPTLSEMYLTDFKVRVLDEKSGTAAKVRVLIQSQDEKENWSTIGVSENIIEASWQALVDSVEYKLLKDLKKSESVAIK